MTFMLNSTNKITTDLRSITAPFLLQSRQSVVQLCIALTASAVIALSQVLVPLSMATFIDAAPRGDLRGLERGIAGLLLAAVLCSIGNGVKAISGRRLTDLFRSHLLMRLLKHIILLPISFSAGNPELASALNDDPSMIAQLANPILLTTVTSLLQILLAVGILVNRFGVWSWLAILVVPINACISLWQWPKAQAASREIAVTKTALNCTLLEVLQGIREIKLLSTSSAMLHQLDCLSSAELVSRFKSYLYGSVDHVRYSATWTLWCSLYLVGGLAVSRGEMSLGTLTALIWYLGFLDQPITRLWQIGDEISNIRPAIERFLSLEGKAAEAQGDTRVSGAVVPQIELTAVTLAYPNGAVALSDVTLTMQAGSHYAVVGPSGAGKTSLVSLLVRLYDPDAGVVRINGIDVREYNLESLRDTIAIVSQDPYLFQGTIRENLRAGTDASNADIEAASRLADAHSFIEAMPNGYESQIASNGVKLSGGQKRRLAIARAIIRRPKVIVLDEVTGSIDAESERSIRLALEKAFHDSIIVTITHRLSSIVDCTAIAVLHQGRLAGFGRHSQLMATSEVYRRMIAAQVVEGPKCDDISDNRVVASLTGNNNAQQGNTLREDFYALQ